MNHAFKIKNSAAAATKAKASVSTLIQERGFKFGSNEFFISSFIELKILGP